MEVKAVRVASYECDYTWLIPSPDSIAERIAEAPRRERERERETRERLGETAGMALAVMEISRDNLPRNAWKTVSNGNGKVHTRFVPPSKVMSRANFVPLDSLKRAPPSPPSPPLVFRVRNGPGELHRALRPGHLSKRAVRCTRRTRCDRPSLKRTRAIMGGASRRGHKVEGGGGEREGGRCIFHWYRRHWRRVGTFQKIPDARPPVRRWLEARI